jgi:transcriptional regulator of aromatic amino acid metabolism
LQPLNPLAGTNLPVSGLLKSEGTLKDLTKAFEDIIIQQNIQKYGSKREAARRLGVDIATLVRKTTRERG